MAERKLTVILAGDHKGLDSALGSAGKSVDGFGSKLASFGKVAALGLAAAGAGAVALGKSFVDAAVESEKVTKQTEAVIKSMGGASNVTADQVANLSEKLSMQSGVDDELIQSASNVLLTFGKVRNEVGTGNDVFDRATQSALDMSVALGTDMQSATVMLGKALNDPVKGITAMTKAGVSFTQQQKDQIKAMVESGDTLGAQKMILAEMEKQFGGSAEAQATAGDKLKVVWGNLQEELGAKLLPVVEKVASFLADKLPGAFDALGKAMKPVGAFFSTLFSGFTEDEGTRVEGVALRIRDVFQQVVAWFQTNWPKIRDVITEVLATVGAVIAGAVDVITTLWDNFGNNIMEVVERIWPRVQQIVEGALAIIRGIVQTVTALIHGDWSGVWEGIQGIVTGAWSAIQGIVGGALELLRGVIGAALEVIGSIFKGAWDAIVGFVSGAVTGIVQFHLELPGRILSALAGLAGILMNAIGNAAGAAKDFAVGKFNEVVSFVTGLPGRIRSAASGMWDGIKDAFKSAVNAIIRGWNRIEFKIPGFHVGPIGYDGFTLGLPDIPTLHKGGIFNSGRGEGLALLKNHEGVFTPEQMRALSPVGDIRSMLMGFVDRLKVAAVLQRQALATGSQGNTVIVNIYGDTTGDEIVERVRRGLERVGIRNGF